MEELRTSETATLLPRCFVEDDQVLTNSRDVAEFFGKNHRDVLRAIDRLECSAEFTQRNFAQTPYIEPQNGQTYRSINIAKDGLAFLVMGFTGKDAARFKEAYIARFNAMQAAIDGSWRSAGSLSKSVIEALAAQRAEVARLEAMVTDLVVAADPRVAAMNLTSVRQLLNDAKCQPKRRNSINRRVGNALRDLALKEGIRGCRRCPHSQVWLFPVEFARRFMVSTGDAWVAAHNAATLGQGILKFPRRVKPAEPASPSVEG